MNWTTSKFLFVASLNAARGAFAYVRPKNSEGLCLVRMGRFPYRLSPMLMALFPLSTVRLGKLLHFCFLVVICCLLWFRFLAA